MLVVRSMAIMTFVTLILISSGCGDGVVTPPPPPGGGAGGADEVSFQQQVLPILTHYGCPTCHGGTSGLTVGTVQQLLQGGLHGPAVIAGYADSSLIIRKTSANPPFGSRMPFGGARMADSSRQVIIDWIDEGAKNN